MHKDELFERIEDSGLLPIPSRQVSEILEILNNPLELDIDYLSEKISSVNQLNELMIKNLNAGYFKTRNEIHTIREAIVYLGMGTVQNLIIFFITQQLFSGRKKDEKRMFNMDHYYRHILGTSIASTMLCDRLKIGDKYKLFSYGLIHDIGIAVLDTCVPEILDEITQKLESGMHQVVAERSILGGITHSGVGVWLCKRWNIPGDITDIVGFHHTPFASQMLTDELKLIYIADVISTEYYEKLLGINLNHQISKRIMDSMGLTDKDVKVIAEKLPGEIEKVKYIL